MYIPNDNTQITHSVGNNFWLKRLDSQLNKATNQNPRKSPKLLGQRIRKRYSTILGTSVIYNPLSPLSLCLVWLWIFLGEFTEVQKVLYDIVLECQETLIKSIRPYETCIDQLYRLMLFELCKVSYSVKFNSDDNNYKSEAPKSDKRTNER